MHREDLTVRQDGPAKFYIEVKSDWLLICFTFVTKSPGYLLMSRAYLHLLICISGDMSQRKVKPEIQTKSIQFSPTGKTISYFVIVCLLFCSLIRDNL